MKRLDQFLVTLFMVVCSITIPHTGIAETKTITCDRSFVILESIGIQEGVFALVGYSGPPQQNVPTILEVNTDGSVMREIQRENLSIPSLFFNAIRLDDDRYLALRYTEGEGTASVGEIISKGQLSAQIEMPNNVSNLYTLTDGLLLICVDRYGECSIEKRNLNGEKLWQTNFAEPMILNDFLERDGSYFLVGRKNEDREASPKGVILKLDSEGELLWRYDSKTYEEYIGVVPGEEEDIIVAGNAYDTDGKTANTDSCAYSFIAKFNDKGQNWKTDCRYGSKELPKDGYVESIVRLENSYLVAVNESGKRNEITLQLFTKEGQLMQSWAESIGDLYRAFYIKLHYQDGAVTLIGNGLAFADNLQAYVTVIKSVPLNVDLSQS